MANDPAKLPPISLDEIGRLIRMLGMLGSNADGEVLNAARFVVRWLAEKGTDWETLLVPEDAGVAGVSVAIGDDDAQAQRVEAAYEEGYRVGFKAMAAQAKAQQSQLMAMAGLAGQGLHPAGQAHWTSGIGGLGGLSAASGAFQAATPQTPYQGPPAPAPGAAGAGQGPLRGNYAQGTWQAVCVELLNRDAAGIPGVFRGSRESQFVIDVLARGFASLTAAQDKWLRDIAGRNGLTW